MKKIFSLFAALTLSAGLWAEGSVFTYTAEENVYGITVNGTPVLGTKNEIPLDPSFEEWLVLNQSLETGDLVTLYNQNGGTTWVGTLDEASVEGIELNATGDAYIITQDGCYDFYMKLKLGADQLYVGSCAAPEYKYTEYENWQLKHEGSEWRLTENLVKVEDGVFKLADANWTGSGFNVASDENPIKKDWFDPKDPDVTIGEEVIPPVIVDVYLVVVDDETVKIGIGVIPVTDPVWPEDAPTTAPAAPTVDGASILGAALTTSYAFEPLEWPGAMPQLLTFETGETIYYMEKMTWQIYTNWDENSYDMSEYNMLHIDLYPATGTEIKVAFEALDVDAGGSGYRNGVVKPLTAGQWNGLDIALSEFPALASGDPYDFSDIKYFVLEGYNAEQSALTVGNVYFYSNPTALPTLFDDGVKGNKFMHKGRFFIVHGGKKINALGAELK